MHSSSLDVNPPALLGPAVAKPAGVGPMHRWLKQCPRLHFCSDRLSRKHSCPSDFRGSVMAGSSNHTTFQTPLGSKYRVVQAATLNHVCMQRGISGPRLEGKRCFPPSRLRKWNRKFSFPFTSHWLDGHGRGITLSSKPLMRRSLWPETETLGLTVIGDLNGSQEETGDQYPSSSI